MGIYDREYYRDKTRGSGWLSGMAPACNAIIVINIAAFVAQKLFQPQLGERNFLDQWFTATSTDIFHKFQVWRLLTATFLHANPMHILFNMVFLWVVGREMESFYGTRNFVALYVSAAIISTLTWTIADEFGQDPGRGYMLGASGAVVAVVVLYTAYYPRREVILFIFPVEMWFLLVIYLGSNLISFLTSRQADPSGSVAYASHLGGAAYGYLYYMFDLRLSRLETFLRRKPRLRIVSAEPRESAPTRPTVGPTWSPNAATSPRPTATVIVPEELFAEKLDEILIKIAREGKGSLSEEEIRVLEEASRRARNRRSERI